jgi:hypothetical protein
MELYQCRTPAH